MTAFGWGCSLALDLQPVRPTLICAFPFLLGPDTGFSAATPVRNHQHPMMDPGTLRLLVIAESGCG